MKRIKYLSFLFVLLLTACVSVSNVVPAGKDTWMVAGSNSRIGADAIMKADLYKTAADFCAGQDKIFTPVSMNYIHLVIGRPASADLTFRCLVEGDPELTRPTMKPVPDTTIEVIEK